MCKQICLYYLFIYVLSIFLAFPKVEIQLQEFYNILFIIRCMKTCAQYSHMMFLRLFLIHTKLHFYLKHLVVLRIIIIKYSVSKRKLLFDLKELQKNAFVMHRIKDSLMQHLLSQTNVAILDRIIIFCLCDFREGANDA